MKKNNSKMQKFLKLDANELGLIVKLEEDGKLNCSVGVCFSEDLDEERQDDCIDLMHGIVGIIQDSPLMLMSFGQAIRPNEGKRLREIIFTPDEELHDRMDEHDRKNTNIIDFSSRKTKQ
tara:strand:+ start:1985 stop:2344 length:360 start_codon:yes stop_codon:yes gene_type:complete